MPHFIRISRATVVSPTNTTYYNLANLAYASFATDPLNKQRVVTLQFPGVPAITLNGNDAANIEKQLESLLRV